MTKEEVQTLKPWDVVVATNYAGYSYFVNVLVKEVTENGVFCLPRIQSTAVLYKFEDLEFQ